MIHLCNEYSMECLLALIEFIQYKEEFFDELEIFPSDDQKSVSSASRGIEEEELRNIKLPKSVPRSSIIANKSFSDREKAHKLFLKYIVVGSDYEINISSRLRNELCRKFESNNGIIMRAISSVAFGRTHTPDSKRKETDSELPFLFDKCCVELLRLLRYSLSRWKAKPEFIKVEKFELNKK